MLRYEVHIDGSIQEDLGFAFARLNDIHLVWFLQDKTFHIEGVANDLRLLSLDKASREITFAFGENETYRLDEFSPLDLHWSTAEKKHLYLRFNFRIIESGEPRYHLGYVLRIKEIVTLEDENGNKNESKEYTMPIINGGSIYLESLKQYLFISGIFPSRNLVHVIYGPSIGVGKKYEIIEGKSTGFKFRNTGGAYETFYDEYQELEISLQDLSSSKDEEKE